MGSDRDPGPQPLMHRVKAGAVQELLKQDRNLGWKKGEADPPL